MSLGGPMSMGTMASAVKYAHDKGVVVVAAAGNDGRGKVGYPAAYPGVIAVASTQFDESTTFYSNWGKEVDIAAPGGNTRVDQNGDGKPDGVLQHTIVPGDIGRSDYLWFMGTSMASPHVAGVAALVVGSGVRKPDAVEKILLGTARAPKGHEAKGGRVDDHYGAGIVDAGAALSKAADARGAGELGLAGAAAPLRPADASPPRRAASKSWASGSPPRWWPARRVCSSCAISSPAAGRTRTPSRRRSRPASPTAATPCWASPARATRSSGAPSPPSA